ncbi:MAG TPA: NUDIX domain-containing protein [Terracidiphilus sp.]|nr:NUDIX domain-containing protein [Terracidiphilus sp.]
MAKRSAGILLYRRREKEIEVFLVHPGGPFWMKKDTGAWSIPKGEYAEGDDPLEAAKREFREETGFEPPASAVHELSEVKLASGKVVRAWSLEGDCDAEQIASNTFAMEWPPKSGKMQEFPEVDRAAWFPLAVARNKINVAQRVFLDRLSSDALSYD